MVFQHPTGKTPETVCIVGFGPSQMEFVQLRQDPNNMLEYDELWSVNHAGMAFPMDLMFHMDDPAMYDPERVASLMRWLRDPHVPVIVPAERKDLVKPEMSCVYPLLDVLQMKNIQHRFNNSVPYMIAYAILIGVKRLYLFGIDYIHPQKLYHAKGIDHAGYWIGQAEARGMQVMLANSSPFLENDFYGYLLKPRFIREG